MSICKELKNLIELNLTEITNLRNKKKLKEDGSYVSEGDLLCETLVKSFLSEKYSDYYLISEESPEQNAKNIEMDNVVILDPIDGTENFVSGLKEWGVAICVYESKKHVESMLALPELDEYIISGDSIKKYNSRIYGLSSSLTKQDLLNLMSKY